MEHRIIHRKPLFGRGVNLLVQLDFTEHEHRLIRDNNMESVVIVEQEPSQKMVEDKSGKKQKVTEDNNIYFGDFYGRRTKWPTESVLHAKELHALMWEGFKRFEEILDINSSPGEMTEGDFSIKPPQPFSIDLIPDYMWAHHAYILAESGGGKTQLLQTIVAQQLKKPKPPGFVIIDSQNQMLQLIKERFPDAIMIDPLNNPPSLDIFKPGLFGGTSHTTVDTFQYLFNVGDEPMTGRQTTAFTYAIALMMFGYPAAYGEHATIQDLEDYLTGEKKGADLTARAHKAANEMPEDLKKWYFSQYGRFADSNAQVMQRLSNICGPLAPLRKLFTKQTDTLNLKDKLENGAIILVNTNRHFLGPLASSFFGRFVFKLLDRDVGDRTEKSHPVLFMVDEVQEYFDATVITPFISQSRKRNISCIFAHQRLSQLNGQEILKDALTGVGTVMTTNVNKNDVRQMASMFDVEPEQVYAWRAEYVEGNKRPSYADFGLIFKGKKAQTFRLKFGQLEALPVHKPKDRPRQEAPRQEAPRQDPPHKEHPKGAPKEAEYDSRYDLLWEMTLSPIKAKNGTVLVIKKLPNGRSTTHPVPPGTKDGYRFCLKKESLIERPDGTIGNLWIELRIAEYESDSREDF